MTISITELTNHSYIDHQLSATLDSTEAFEGPEKLLEIWFFPHVGKVPGEGKTLRDVPVETWVSILQLVKCEVLSIKSTPEMDAFLLSESSMFIYPHRMTLKTCGTTTTLFCLPRLFEILHELLGWDFRNEEEGKFEPFKVFYSRRAFMFPSKQKSIHRNWGDEVDYLNAFFCSGKSYVVGRFDDRKHWNLYVTDTKEQDEQVAAVEESPAVEDETFEILMTGLDPECTEQFVSHRQVSAEPQPLGQPQERTNDDADDDGHLLGYSMTRKTGLDNVYNTASANSRDAEFHHDAFAFSPCGYSSNMIVDNHYYYTLHVTPEKGWSYASFESNVPVSEISNDRQDNVDVLRKVLNVFRPREFCLTFFAKSAGNKNFDSLQQFASKSRLYEKKERIIYDLEDYQLLYIRFERK
ncbi:adenosylmethionine decarboxylase SPE2 KNAG_0J00530 [Huiozyma naganishii CBS 8797]|uniref:adenosylmethionine decarboxylase n=1 Tax=Huiozyma naganishii (strain ATCC MYA-139 / BCRC 22969 / CBS 8797 / KCTC 17520 / NBRC 10181 / NCYC 3082 / Yp74L-3) TaxID=1071383 RepID=J7SAG1_HUIN7|nr:hypothetical protein KNAG_0J00530 [Kazachstania naganishii CBS 8797]CCK72136.1 hypothetical protein KNAG_0J00530 [Kazachstania naganishii CBS 8797]